MKTFRIDSNETAPSKIVCIGRNYLGRIRQPGNEIPEEMLIFNKYNATLKTFTALEDGDIVMTGTPSGVGRVNAGERFTGRIPAAGRELLSHAWLAE
jgi:2-keto-4-pentenoate hydratase/2-oxohepta-3-ene-1,7-dioic acid hydratase in catechol pathway